MEAVNPRLAPPGGYRIPAVPCPLLARCRKSGSVDKSIACIDGVAHRLLAFRRILDLIGAESQLRHSYTIIQRHIIHTDCPPLLITSTSDHFNFRYASSATGSSHSALDPGIEIATWANQLSEAAPCQCLTSGGMLTTSPGCSSRGLLPHSW